MYTYIILHALHAHVHARCTRVRRREFITFKRGCILTKRGGEVVFVIWRVRTPGIDGRRRRKRKSRYSALARAQFYHKAELWKFIIIWRVLRAMFVLESGTSSTSHRRHADKSAIRSRAIHFCYAHDILYPARLNVQLYSTYSQRSQG